MSRSPSRSVALATLPNLGPKSQAMLARAGITTLARLQRLGAVRAYVQVKRREPRASLNLLWALQGLLTGRAWQAVARADRLSLLMQLDALMADAPTPPVRRVPPGRPGSVR